MESITNRQLGFRAPGGATRRWLCNLVPHHGPEGAREVLLVASDVTEEHDARREIDALIESTSTHIGVEFLQRMVLELGPRLGADCLFVGEALGEHPDRVRTIAVCAAGSRGENFEYDLEGTPCQEVVRQRACFHPTGVQALFPRDELLVEMGIDSYFGVPLFDARGTRVGLVAAVSRRPMQDNTWARTLFSLFGARAGVELDRLQRERRQRSTGSRPASELDPLHARRQGFAHELNNILTGIFGNSELIATTQGCTEEMQGYCTEIQEAAMRAGELVRECLSSGRSRDPE